MTLNATTLYDDVYVNTAGDYNSKTRTFWKDCTAAGNVGTPTAWINAVKITTFPMSVDGWMEILETVLSEQVN